MYKTINGITYYVYGSKLFVPLTQILRFVCASDPATNGKLTKYFFEPETNKVWSRATGTFTKLSGSVGRDGDTVFNFMGQRIALATIMREFAAFAKANSSMTNTVTGASSEQNFSDSISMVRNDVIIGSLKNGIVSFSARPKIHKTPESWKPEMERLAKSNPGVRFVAVSVVASIISEGVTWE